MALRSGVLNKIIAIFKKHGAENIDTPVFELKVSSVFTLDCYCIQYPDVINTNANKFNINDCIMQESACKRFVRKSMLTSMLALY